MEYWMVKTEEGPGIDGGLMRRMAPDQAPTNVVPVPSVDDATTRMVWAGASRQPPPG
jgi:hypothetical protein